eukprot:m.33829 g.33829  ORF g.33829 m.33829 type:complete len:52 (-) comp9673_c0_seq4:2193-2348(-)
MRVPHYAPNKPTSTYGSALVVKGRGESRYLAEACFSAISTTWCTLMQEEFV